MGAEAVTELHQAFADERQRSLESQEKVFAGIGRECFEQTLFLSVH